MVPEIHFRSSKKREQFFNGTYEFWSLNGIKNIEQVNDITLLVALPCIENLDTLSIPIINGKPFGKEERHQTVKMKLKNQ